MPDSQLCAKCGAPLPDDAAQHSCPTCALRDALALGVSKGGWSPPSSIETSSSLPQRIRYFGDYLLLEEIARGGMGVVYRARQVSLNRTVAVKMILAGQLASAADVQRFRAEAEAVAQLQHPNIVSIHEVGEHEDQHYFSMDYVPGKNLAGLVGDQPLPAAHAASMLKTIAEAIHYAHQRGILHRDLKPTNVLIDIFGQPRITDFGLARQITGDSDLTATGQVLGSPNFMPPEQASGRRAQVAPPSDVYSLGAILYYLMTGRPPFVAKTLAETLHHVCNVDPVSPRVLNPSVPRDLETMCLKCLEKDSRRRYHTAQEVADELGRFLRDEPILARPVNPSEKLWRWSRRRPALAWLILTLSALIMVLALLFRDVLQQGVHVIPPLPTRSGNGASGVIDGKLYVATPCDGTAGFHRHFHYFDPAARAWKSAAALPHPHNSPASGVINGLLYLAGGWDDDGKPSAQLDAYDPKLNAWKTLSSMPTPRVTCAGAVIDGQLYVVGGRAGTDLAILEVYNPRNDSWTTQTPPPTPRHGLALVAVGDTLYAIGGVIRTALGHQYTDLVEIYDTNARKWRQGPPMMKPSGHSFAIVHEGVIYVVAGLSEDRAWAEESRLLHGFESTLMQAYDLAAKRWSVLPTPMPAPRYEGDGAQLFDGQLCMIGGWSTISSTGEDDKLPRREVFQYDPRRKAWSAPIHGK